MDKNIICQFNTDTEMCVCLCVCETIRPGAAGVGSNPPSRSNRSPPAVFAGLETRPGAGIPTARLDC